MVILRIQKGAHAVKDYPQKLNAWADILGDVIIGPLYTDSVQGLHDDLLHLHKMKHQCTTQLIVGYR